jgi:Holliday junction resolvase RusA-like endonuclease
MREMVTIHIKPLSVNEVWQGRRFKTKTYQHYERALLFQLPKIQLPEPPYKIYFEFGLSSVLSDWDNPVKPLQDVLQKKYGFNDKHIMEANVKKVKVSKGKEYFSFFLESVI